MPGATSNGYPYAVNTDAVEDGAETIEDLATHIDSRAVFGRFVGGLAAFTGSSPPAGTVKIRKEFTAVAMTDATGLFAVTYPGGAFPNGVVSVVVEPGDAAGDLVATALQQSVSSLSVVRGKSYGLFDANFSTNIRVNVIAVGW